MRKFVAVCFVVFAASIFALSGVAQRRARARGHGHGGGGNIPQSAQIAQELGGIQWGWSHDQVIDYFRRAITARYQPLLRNKGQVEQDHLMAERDQQVQGMRDSYVVFDGAANHRRWDTSFVGSEYTHNNGESMLVQEDSSNGNREFFFFINDHLWKRFQARQVPRGSGLDYAGFVSRIETLFGAGFHINDPDHPDRLATVVWQDQNTRLHLVDNSTFYGAFCLVYEQKSTLARIAELRHNMPAKQASGDHQQVAIDQPAVGNVEGDSNEDIVDRITGKIRHTQNGPANPGQGNGPSSSNSGSNTGNSGANNPPPSGNTNQGGGGNENDPLGGL